MDKLRRKFGFTLVEILIVVALLGILAAIVIPLYENNSQKAKESAAKENLRVLRNAIELYAAKNGGVPPGYSNNDTSNPPGFTSFFFQIVRDNDYLSSMPENPFNNKISIKIIADNEVFPNLPTGQTGWIYKPQTKTIKIDWTGNDSTGVSYYDY